MTRQRNDNHSTEFGLWLRDQEALDSRTQKFSAVNIDYHWSNYSSGKWIWIEEKRYGSMLTYSQQKVFPQIHQNILASGDVEYAGFWIITFSQTSPDDGTFYLVPVEHYKNRDRSGIRCTEPIQMVEFLTMAWFLTTDSTQSNHQRLRETIARGSSSEVRR